MRLSRAVIFLGGSALATAQLVTIDPSTDTNNLHRSSHWGDKLDRTEHQGSTVSFTFTGTSLKIVLGAWRDYGDVSILLDGQTIKVTTYSNTTHVGSMTAFDQAPGLSYVRSDPEGGCFGGGKIAQKARFRGEQDPCSENAGGRRYRRKLPRRLPALSPHVPECLTPPVNGN
ncbi:hypothetical protein EXIGLDRAFT_724330 [Exidia glandulosa HHB12029]|uniref:Uncharacterized protein n=1 Tax=Exidia glandulosa HHB12029 TaxID=1314781 RepID=A0A165EGR3_EXIGL|nr:hypothetical protein EXIGLDRAFT_724330 [Exidia glandulosa HHB12029]